MRTWGALVEVGVALEGEAQSRQPAVLRPRGLIGLSAWAPWPLQAEALQWEGEGLVESGLGCLLAV